LILLCVLFFIQGFAQGSTDLGGTNLIFTMWGVNAAAPLNTAHLGYGIGAVFVNLLVRPFLTGQTIVTTDSVVNSSSTSDNVIKANSNIFVPYSITAALCILIAVGHIFFYLRALKSQREKLQVRQVMKISCENDSVIHIDV
jgi:fucose permease